MIRKLLPLLLCALPLAGQAQTSSSGTNAASTPAKDWTGYAGLGAVGYSRYVGGKGVSVLPAPLLSFEYKETVYVDLVRAGVRFWSSEDNKMALGLAAEPRFGFKSGDGPRLAGMSERRISVESGPSFEWDAPFASFNLAYFADATRASRGASLRGSVYKQVVDNARWDVGPYAGFERINGKVANYYFGVQAGEATADRPAYQPGAATNWLVGISGAYKFGNGYALMFGVQNTRLGGAAASSPIVETRNAKLGYIGLGWVL
jgi:outer membrane protein